MDEVTYRAWWTLHLRVATGEKLNTAERREYDAGIQRLDSEDLTDVRQGDDLDALREMRDHVRAADAEYQRLSNQYKAMRAEMVRLESLLDEDTRQALGVGR